MSTIVSTVVDNQTWDYITFPNGERIIYVDANHSYWLCKEDDSRGKRLTSVSTIVGPWGFNPEYLMKWAASLTLEGVVRCMRGEAHADVCPECGTLSTGHGLDPPPHCGHEFGRYLPVEVTRVPSTALELQERLNEAELTHEHLRDQAGDRGDLVHETLEALAGVREFPSLEDASEIEQSMVAALMRWWERSEPEVIASEQFVYDSHNRFAGRLDLRARLNGKTVLLDLKTSKRVRAKFLVQLAGYDLGSIACGHGPADELIVLHVPEGAEIAREVVSPATHEDFLTGLNLYRRANELDKVC